MMAEESIIGCPKCLSTQITANRKGFSGGKAVTGAILTGGIGLLAGFHGKDKVIITCLSCGNTFRPGDGKKIYPAEIEGNTTIQKANLPFVSSSVTGEKNRIICSICNVENLISHKNCKNCGLELKETDRKIYSKIKTELMACPSCKKLTSKDAKFCPHCVEKVELKSNGDYIIIIIIIITCFLFLLILFHLLK